MHFRLTVLTTTVELCGASTPIFQRSTWRITVHPHLPTSAKVSSHPTNPRQRHFPLTKLQPLKANEQEKLFRLYHHCCWLNIGVVRCRICRLFCFRLRLLWSLCPDSRGGNASARWKYFCHWKYIPQKRMSPASQYQVRNYFRKSLKALEIRTGKAPWSGIDLKGLMPGKNNGQFPISFLPTISMQYIYFCGCRVVRF